MASEGFRNVLLHTHACTWHYYLRAGARQNGEESRIQKDPSLPFSSSATASSARNVRRWIHEHSSACPWKRVAESRPRDPRGANPGDGERRDAGQYGRQAGLGYTQIQASPFHGGTGRRGTLTSGRGCPMIVLRGLNRPESRRAHRYAP